MPTITAAEDYSTRKYPTLLLVYFAHFAFDHGSAAVPFFAFTSSILFSLGLVCFRDWLGPQMWDQSLPNWHRNARPQAHVGPAHPVQEGAGATFSGEDGPRRDRDHLGGWRVGPGRYDFEGVLLQVFLCLNLFSSGLLEVSSFRRGACLSPLRGTLHQVHFFAGLFDPLFSTHLNKLELIFVFLCHALRSTPRLRLFPKRAVEKHDQAQNGRGQLGQLRRSLPPLQAREPPGGHGSGFPPGGVESGARKVGVIVAYPSRTVNVDGAGGGGDGSSYSQL